MAASDVPTHKVFVSYHHAEDEAYKNTFCEKLSPNFVDKSVEDGDIDPERRTDTIRRQIRERFIADATVTVVLIGKCTWQRKHVDWEIGSSLIKNGQELAVRIVRDYSALALRLREGRVSQ